MINKEDIEEIIVTKEEIICCINKALKIKLIDNLRERDELVKLDSKIRGFIGEKAILKWFQRNGFTKIKSDYIEDCTDTINIDLFLEDLNLSFEIKTSLIPDRWKTLEKSIELGDIKIIARTKNIKDLNRDYYIQIYFNYIREERDNMIKKLEIDINKETNHDKLCDIIYQCFEYKKLRCYFVAWVSKADLINYLNKLKEEGRETVWIFGKREFWKCPIKELGKKPSLLIKKIRDYYKN